MARSIFVVAALLSASLTSASQTLRPADTTLGFVLYAFSGGGCGLSEHDAPTGLYPHIDIREFYRWNVSCASTNGGYASSGWPATGTKSLSKYLAFQLIPEPEHAVRILPGGFSFKVRSDGTGPDSVEVVLETAYVPLRTIMRASATSELRTVQGVTAPVVIGAPTLVRLHAWRSDTVAGGTAPGTFFIDDVTLNFQIYPLSTSAMQDHAQGAARTVTLSAWPNPFNPATKIGYHLEQEGRASVSVFDMLGRRVADLFDGPEGAGDHEITWDASAQPSGMYLVRLATDRGSAMHKLLLAR